MRFSITALVAGLCLTRHAAAAFLRGTAMDIGPDDDTLSAETLHKRAENFNGWGTFDQLIDHANPALGTFQQRYWYGTEYWKGPGSPIYLVTPGEQAGTGFNKTWTTSARLSGLMANQTGGAVVILEHRYWGESSPYANLTVKNLQYLTLDNSLKDLVHFAKTFKPPFDTSGKSAVIEVPWVVIGGSYSGALAGWLASVYPGTFWAYYSSSGVVETVGDFWSYFAPVQSATPKNCSADVNSVIEYVDFVLTFGSHKQKDDLKKKFLMEDLEDADFASAIESGPWQWQSGQFYSAKTLGYTPFYRFCDYVENVWPNSTNKVPGAGGVGLTKALDGYAKYMREEYLPGYCEAAGYDDWKGKYNVKCFQNLNASNVAYKDLTPGNWANRQWTWMLCNEPFEWWQDGAPLTQPTLVSRLVNVDYWRKQCPLAFPPSEGSYGIARGKTAQDVNRRTGGWFATDTTRAMYTNGEWDPWRDATMSSDFRPGGPLKSSKKVPVRVVKHGTHCSDLYGQNWDVNAEVKQLALDAAANMKEWIAEFYDEKGRAKPWE